ncbi:peptide-methionine (S)-S-oxide reductase [Methanohalophilus levihalophilus]|uniref:peptide-methionine (S)-S-oxide reductase MsrA n=1 Tax=Methanohalophilus levihalophilus TaxID=1431282 RepID=UPI001AE87403|nr:peptide-methionine (S)-S-oxide reductase MsrA [Methanohalophilus levihalophilus]MBP2029577.1 peptide-methionine (S)-S-oxide reductase [Methanohalophilus levihalophilus]
MSEPDLSGSKYQIATFAAGCFWGVESAFRKVEGVVSTTVGYTGGSTQNPSYQDVSTGKTGHAESIRIVFDPEKVSYKQLLDVFWSIHDPTTSNRQGPDIGSQYRSVIFYHDALQEKEAIESRDTLLQSGKHGSKIVTEIVSASDFFPAEEYHQQYFEKAGYL